MPQTPAKIRCQLGINSDVLQGWESAKVWGGYKTGLKVEKGEAMFPRIDLKKEIEELAKISIVTDKDKGKDKDKITKEIQHLIRPENPLENIPSQELALNDIALVQLKLANPIYLDAFATNKSNGAFILIDSQSNNTVAVGFVE